MAASTTNQPGELNLTIQQGATYSLVLTWNDSAGSPVDLTGYTALMDVVSTSTRTQVATWGTVSGEITLGGVAGTITLTLPAATTAAFTWTSGDYDLKMTATSNSTVTYLVAGTATVNPSVTP